MGEPRPRFLCDEHVSVPFCHALGPLGIDAVHVLDLGLQGASDPEILQRARSDGRILITRNYHDFVALAQAWARGEMTFPGLLLISSSIGHEDVGAHVRALTTWVESGQRVENTFVWLT